MKTHSHVRKEGKVLTDYLSVYQSWLDAPGLDESSRAELIAIRNDEKEIEDRFYCDLSFGTAGLRGMLGAGTNRMNVPVVRRASAGLAAWLSEIPGAKERGVCIAYDSRHCSALFAREAAGVLAASGVRVKLFSTLHAVPQLSFAVRHLNCIAGVVITASHNPRQYNGYKVYWEHGGQVGPAQADAILARIERTPMFSAKGDPDSPLIELIGPEEDEAYYAATAGLLLDPENVRERGASLRLVYTPLFGTGRVPVSTLLARAGVTNVTVVPAQAEPDGDFPGLAAPNPEDPAAFTEAIALAEQNGATVCLATDPDADRLGVAVKTREGGWATLTGNQIGCILLSHILSSLDAQGRLPDNGAVVKSIVSTRLADAIAARYGVALYDVMTGFRFISEKIDQWVRTGEKTFLFGFEESFGFLAGGLSRDKDAVCAALLVSECCIDCAARGMTLYDRLQEIYATYGHYGEKVQSYTLGGKEGMERIASCMEALRQNPPDSVAGHAVLTREDYRARTRVTAGSPAEPLSLPQANMLRFLLAGEIWIVVRPSGTEPKLKLYIGARADSDKALCVLLDSLYAEFDARLKAELGL